MPDEVKLLNLKQTAKLLGVHINTVSNYSGRGLPVHAYTPGGHRRYHPDDVAAFHQRIVDRSRPLSSHDLYITTTTMIRQPLATAPKGLELTCSRAWGWSLWMYVDGEPRCIAGESEGPEKWLILDVAGRVILDSRPGRHAHDTSAWSENTGTDMVIESDDTSLSASGIDTGTPPSSNVNDHTA